MKFISTLIILAFTLIAFSFATEYSGFTISSSGSTQPCNKSIPQTDVGTCIDVCGLGHIKIVADGDNKYNITGYGDTCVTPLGINQLVCGKPTTFSSVSIDCTPVTTPSTTTGDSTATVASFTLIIVSLLSILLL
ncbi:hypothetical protein RB653_000193 [Dictyostelium firmibasis]|uniref:Uncharacterized protein n=1 Tax=Dictyostelium firmibasis TaxID=79012 RepID=A0AAN7U2G9_9MYCE